MRLVYDILLFIALVLYFPIHIVRLFITPKYRSSTLARIGFQRIPQIDSSKPSFWIHSVSVGESQVAAILCRELLQRQPEAQIIVSTITETGQAVAKKIDGIAGTIYYPVDLSVLVSSIFKKIKPDAVLIVETDLWFNLLNQCYKNDVPLYLVNGKISETTLKRYQQFPRMAHLLLRGFKHFFTQSETYLQRFSEVGIDAEKLSVCGNVKLDSAAPLMTDEQCQSLAKRVGLNLTHPIVTFGSTHAGEEELAVKTFLALQQSHPQVQCVLVPRHPERFKAVATMLKNAAIDFNQSSRPADTAKSFLLVDEMGALMNYYQITTVAVVGGSFIAGVGGHNILEPSFYGKPFIYGPWIYKQPGFHQINLDAKAGVQCNAEALVAEVQNFIESPDRCREFGQRGLTALQASKGAAQKIVEQILKSVQQ